MALDGVVDMAARKLFADCIRAQDSVSVLVVRGVGCCGTNDFSEEWVIYISGLALRSYVEGSVLFGR